MLAASNERGHMKVDDVKVVMFAKQDAPFAIQARSPAAAGSVSARRRLRRRRRGAGGGAQCALRTSPRVTRVTFEDSRPQEQLRRRGARRAGGTHARCNTHATNAQHIAALAL
jgi:hypothetical protein